MNYLSNFDISDDIDISSSEQYDAQVDDIPQNIDLLIYEEELSEEYDHEEEEEETCDIFKNEEQMQECIRKANNHLIQLPSFALLSFHINSICSILKNYRNTEEVQNILEPLLFHLKFDRPRYYNMLGCRLFQWRKATNNSI